MGLGPFGAYSPKRRGSYSPITRALETSFGHFLVRGELIEILSHSGMDLATFKLLLGSQQMPKTKISIEDRCLTDIAQFRASTGSRESNGWYNELNPASPSWVFEPNTMTIKLLAELTRRVLQPGNERYRNAALKVLYDAKHVDLMHQLAHRHGGDIPDHGFPSFKNVNRANTGSVATILKQILVGLARQGVEVDLEEMPPFEGLARLIETLESSLGPDAVDLIKSDIARPRFPALKRDHLQPYYAGMRRAR